MNWKCSKIRPEKNVETHFGSFVETQQIYELPPADLENSDPQTNLAIVRHELNETNLSLNTKKEQWMKKRKRLSEEWKNLEDCEKEFQQSFIRFNKFVRENAEKRERMSTRISYSKAYIKESEERIAQMTEDIENMNIIKAAMDTKLAEYQIYEDYLQTVIDKYPAFKHVDNLTNQYEIMISAKDHLFRAQKMQSEELQELQQELDTIIDKKVLYLMWMYHRIMELRERYDAAYRKASTEENRLVNTKVESIEKLGEQYEISYSIWLLYIHMCQKKGAHKRFKKDDVENQLKYIKEILLELRLVRHYKDKLLRTKAIKKKIR